MSLALKENVATDPRDVGFLGPTTVVTKADGRADTIEQTWLGSFCGTGFVQRRVEIGLTAACQHGYEAEELIGGRLQFRRMTAR